MRIRIVTMVEMLLFIVSFSERQWFKDTTASFILPDNWCEPANIIICTCLTIKRNINVIFCKHEDDVCKVICIQSSTILPSMEYSQCDDECDTVSCINESRCFAGIEDQANDSFNKNCSAVICDASTTTKQISTSSTRTQQKGNNTPPRSSTTENNSPSTNVTADKSLSAIEKTGIIIGVVVGGILAIAFVLVLAVLLFRRRRGRKQTEAETVNQSTDGYQHMVSGGIRPPVAPYDNLMNMPSSAEQNSNRQTESSVNFYNEINGDTSADSSDSRADNDVKGYDNIRNDGYTEITASAAAAGHVTGANALNSASAPPGESDETILVDNQFYGDNAFNAHLTSNTNEGETTVIDNHLYGK